MGPGALDGENKQSGGLSREQADSSVPVWLGCCVPQHFLQPLDKKNVKSFTQTCRPWRLQSSAKWVLWFLIWWCMKTVRYVCNNLRLRVLFIVTHFIVFRVFLVHRNCMCCVTWRHFHTCIHYTVSILCSQKLVLKNWDPFKGSLAIIEFLKGKVHAISPSFPQVLHLGVNQPHMKNMKDGNIVTKIM